MSKKLNETNSDFVFPQATPDWLEKRTILLAPSGSYAYGTNTSASDKDYKGICIPPIDYYLGLESFNEYNKTGGKNFRNTKEDVDVSILHINKFVKDAMLGVPNNIEMLFIESDKYSTLKPAGTELIEHRHLFLSKQVTAKFGGFAYSQMKRMQFKKSNGSGRQDLVSSFGYDTKFFMHSIRLLTSAIEILETNDFHTYRPNRDFLLDCRNGVYSESEALAFIEHYDDLLKIASENSALPVHPDYKKINQLLIKINKEAIFTDNYV